MYCRLLFKVIYIILTIFSPFSYSGVCSNLQVQCADSTLCNPMSCQASDGTCVATNPGTSHCYHVNLIPKIDVTMAILAL